jgi:hypothetical protein
MANKNRRWTQRRSDSQQEKLKDFDSRLALNLAGDDDEYLAVYLTAKEARKIAQALLNSVK